MKRTSWQIQQAVIFALVLRELKTRFGGRLAGVIWVLFEPLGHIVALLLLRVALREKFAGVLIDVPVYLIVAMIPFFLFRNIWFRVMDSVDSNSGLFSYRQVKPADAMVGRALLEIIIYVMVFFCLMSFFAWMGYQFLPDKPLEYLAIFAAFVMMGVGFGVVSAVTTHAAPAVRSFLRLLSFPLYMLSGVMIPLDAFPPVLHTYLLWNPLMHLVEYARETFFASHGLHPGVNLEYPVVVIVTFLVLGASLYRVRRLRLLVRN